MAGRRGVVVLGKHDATTAAAMIGLILENAGEDPCVLLNAPARQLGGWSRLGAGACFVTTWDHPPEALAGVDPEIFVLLDSKRELSPEMLARASITAPGAVLIADDSRRKTTHEFLARKGGAESGCRSKKGETGARRTLARNPDDFPSVFSIGDVTLSRPGSRTFAAGAP